MIVLNISQLFLNLAVAAQDYDLSEACTEPWLNKGPYHIGHCISLGARHAAREEYESLPKKTCINEFGKPCKRFDERQKIKKKVRLEKIDRHIQKYMDKMLGVADLTQDCGIKPFSMTNSILISKHLLYLGRPRRCSKSGIVLQSEY